MNKPTPGDGRSGLRREVEELRSESRIPHQPAGTSYPSWKKLLIFTIILLSISISVFLLIFAPARLRVSTGMVSMVLDQPGSESELYRLPPPPPKRVEPRVVVQGPYAVGPPGADTDDSILYSSPDSPGFEDGGEEEAAETFVPPEITTESARAFQMMLEQSDLVGRLARNQLEGYEFREWKPRADRAPVFFIDTLAMRASDDREVLFVWEINTETGDVRPVNQNARDLVTQLE